ncbi:MAG: YdaU family protein [Pseudomonas sp.]|nr:YdaU family protein [Pseudomonas sp.]
MTATDLPAPLVLADVDLRGLPFMPLDVNRLRDSDLAIEASGDEFRAAVLLWCASWNQVPAGSLPDAEQALAAYAGFGRDLKSWKKVRDGALRGFVKCADGRLYHPVVAEKAIDAWAQRVEHRAAKESENKRKEKERQDRARIFAALREAGQVLPFNTTTKALREAFAALELLDSGVTSHGPVTVTGHAPDTAKRGRGTGNREGEGQGIEPPLAPLGDQSQGQQPEAPAKKPAAKGVRAKPKKPLPMPFLITEDMLAWAKEKTPAVNIDRETEGFIDYWKGTGESKADWPATWRNRMRRMQDDLERRGLAKPVKKDPNDTSWIEEDDGV